MEITNHDWNVLSKECKDRIRELDARLQGWEERIHYEARQQNAALQKRRRDPHDRMTSGTVVVGVSYWSADQDLADVPLVERSFNATIIGDDDPLGARLGLRWNGERPTAHRHTLGPVPCSFLLYDLCEQLFERRGIEALNILAMISALQVEVQVKARFFEEVTHSQMRESPAE